MAGWSAVHMSLAVCLSSALTLLAILLLIRPGHDNIVTYVVDQMRYPSYSPSPSSSSSSSHSHSSSSSSSSSSCPSLSHQRLPQTSITPWRQDLTPTTFVKAPWKNPVYDGAGDYLGSSSEDDYWGALLTPNGGFLDIDLQDGVNHSVGVSMFHQLHCLHMIRGALLDDGDSMHDAGQHGSSMSQRRNHLEKQKKKKGGHNHVLHCFDYIAQAMLCAADDAVEGYLVRFDADGMEDNPISGEGQVHQCRNATRLFEFVRESVQKPVLVSLLGEHSVFPD